jgi:preprotein translocase subunit SecG
MHTLFTAVTDYIKHTDYFQKFGGITSILFGSASFLNGFKDWLQIIFLIISIVLAFVTFLYTQEKRKVLKKTQNDNLDN